LKALQVEICDSKIKLSGLKTKGKTENRQLKFRKLPRLFRECSNKKFRMIFHRFNPWQYDTRWNLLLSYFWKSLGSFWNLAVLPIFQRTIYYFIITKCQYGNNIWYTRLHSKSSLCWFCLRRYDFWRERKSSSLKVVPLPNTKFFFSSFLLFLVNLHNLTYTYESIITIQ